MPLDPAFVDDSPYAPDGLLIDDIMVVDRTTSRLVARMPTDDDLPITRTQRAHPVRHPRHVSGGLMVHMTGIVALAHAYFVLDIKHRDGWIGYGARIHNARFLSLAPPGAPLHLDCTCTQLRRGTERILARYRFLFSQEGTPVYESDQTALWMRVAEG